VAPRDDLALLALTAAAAGTDAISYLGLGHVFCANMTGNTVLLGLGVATGDLAGASRSATALGAFVLGALGVGATLSGNGWTRGLAAAFGVECLLLAVLTAWWAMLAHTPDGATRYGLIGLAGASIGIQSAIVRRLRVPDVTTTYITGTWAALSTAIGARVARRPGLEWTVHARQAGVVALYPVGALAVAGAFRLWHGYATLIPTGLLTVVVVHAMTRAVRRQRLSGRRT
jgi:uncharacterized membrane protein YoaK (UPF0700 family)